MGIDINNFEPKFAGTIKVQTKIICSKENCNNHFCIEMNEDFEEIELFDDIVSFPLENEVENIKDQLIDKVVEKAEGCGWFFPAGMDKNYCPKHKEEVDKMDDEKDKEVYMKRIENNKHHYHYTIYRSREGTDRLLGYLKIDDDGRFSFQASNTSNLSKEELKLLANKIEEEKKEID